MCYSVRTSVLAYTIGLVASLIAFKTRQIPLGFLILFYVQIQLAEALIWRGIDTDSTTLNHMGTMLAKYTLALHLFGLGIGIYLVYQKKLPLLFGILFFIAVSVYYCVWEDHTNLTYPLEKCEKREKRECQHSKNRLNWKFGTDWYIFLAFLTTICYLIYVKDPLQSKVFVVSFFTLTYLLSRVFVPSSNTTSSFWCFASAFGAPLLVLINSFLI